MNHNNDPYPAEALIDRGQMNLSESETWASIIRAREYAAILETKPLDKWDIISRKRYLDFTSEFPEEPENFKGYFGVNNFWETQWFSVETENVIGLINSLTNLYSIDLIDLKNHTPAALDFPQNAGDDYFLVSPPCNGQVFIQWTGLKQISGQGHYLNYTSILRHDWARISEDFGDVYFFRNEDRDNGFVFWQNGKMLRAVANKEDRYTDLGPRLHGENIDKSGDTKRIIDLGKFASVSGTNPKQIRPYGPDEPAYAWLVDG